MVFNIHNGSYHPPCCFGKSICSPWCLVSYRESFWSEVANPSTRSGKRNMSRCVIMASLLTTPVYMWVSTPPSLPFFPFHFFSNWLYVFVTLLFVLEGAAGGFNVGLFFSLDAITFTPTAVVNRITSIPAHDFYRDVWMCVTAILANPVTWSSVLRNRVP